MPGLPGCQGYLGYRGCRGYRGYWGYRVYWGYRGYRMCQDYRGYRCYRGYRSAGGTGDRLRRFWLGPPGGAAPQSPGWVHLCGERGAVRGERGERGTAG